MWEGNVTVSVRDGQDWKVGGGGITVRKFTIMVTARHGQSRSINAASLACISDPFLVLLLAVRTAARVNNTRTMQTNASQLVRVTHLTRKSLVVQVFMVVA